MDNDATPAPVVLDEVLQHELHVEQLRRLYASTASVVWANMLAVAAVVFILWGAVRTGSLLGWAGLCTVLLVVRSVHSRVRQKAAGFPNPVRRYELEFVAGVALFASAFSVGAVRMLASIDDYQRALVVVAVAGMTAGAAISMAGFRRAYFVYALVLLMPLASYTTVHAMNSERAVWPEVFVVVSYLAVMVVVHSRASAATQGSMLLQLRESARVRELANENAGLARDRDSYRESSLTDALTGISNRRAFEQALADEWRRGTRAGTSLGCLMLDIDKFKQYNDNLGHDAGDACIARVAQALADVARRGGDTVARYGGEEFVVLLPDTRLDGVGMVGEYVRAAVESLALPHPSPDRSCVTVSVGAASMVPEASTRPSTLVRRADRALYEAKSAGRNNVQLDRLQLDPEGSDTGEATLIMAETEAEADAATAPPAGRAGQVRGKPEAP